MRLAISFGNMPTRLLPERLSELMLPHPNRTPATTLPDMRLLERSRYCKPEHLMNAGISPEILFPERSNHRIPPAPALTIHWRSP
uniref:Uncharacterized protein n=1 Tax=Arundo donax TaxID=35708 RepID=A0A0A8YYS7_ARUDO